MSSFNDHYSGHAADYRAFRPTYPLELFAFLASVAPTRELVWDCATGNGQAAISLAEHFTRVFATDASAEQVKNAEQHQRVEYAVAPAEACPLPDACIDLVTVAQALHWFEFNRFYSEVRRVCKPGGLLAAWSYDFHSVNPHVDPILQRLEADFIRTYWPTGREYVDAGYRTIPFPFEEVEAPKLEMTAEWSLGALLGYMNTWSAVKRFEKANGFNPLARLEGQFAEAWVDPEIVRTVRWKLVLRVGRVDAH